jgi:hypothetical protein
MLRMLLLAIPLLSQLALSAADAEADAWYAGTVADAKAAVEEYQKVRLCYDQSNAHSLAQMLRSKFRVIRRDIIRRLCEFDLPDDLYYDGENAERVGDSALLTAAREKIERWASHIGDGGTCLLGCIRREGRCRLSALDRLRALGLPNDLDAEFTLALRNKDLFQTGSTVRKIETWLGTHDLSKAQLIEPGRAIAALADLCRSDVSLAATTTEQAQQASRIVLGLSDIISAEQSFECAYVLVLLFDYDDLSKEVSVPSGREVLTASASFLKAMRTWMRANLQYCFLHPRERRLRLDFESRKNLTPTAEYRKTHTWNGDEGPNRVDPKKVPKRGE